MNRRIQILCAAVAFLVVGPVVFGPVAMGQIRPAQVGGGPEGARVEAPSAADDMLGDVYSSVASGIALRPPVGGKIQRRAAGDAFGVATFVSVEDNWRLVVTRLIFEDAINRVNGKPVRLMGRDDPKTPNVDESLTEPGLVEATAQLEMDQNKGTRILHQGLANVGTHDVGMLAMRQPEATAHVLHQKAIYQADDKQYYVLDFVTPSTWTPAMKDDDVDAGERAAVEAFDRVLKSIRILDQRPVEADRVERLFATRALMVNLQQSIGKAMKPEQHFRLVREGKDVGWMFVAENPGAHANDEGFFCATHANEDTADGVRIKTASEMFSSWPKGAGRFKNEAWASATVLEKGAQKDFVSEFGLSEIRSKLIRNAPNNPGLAANPNGPLMVPIEVHPLNVTQTSKGGQVIKYDKEMPPFYVPLAVSHLLPRLLPLNQAKGYVFYVWNPAMRGVIYRYIDVENQRQVQLDGNKIQAVVVKDRLGLEGEPTLHYFDPATGAYLGSYNTDSKTSLLVSDAKTLAKKWPQAQIERPHLLDNPQGR